MNRQQGIQIKYLLIRKQIKLCQSNNEIILGLNHPLSNTQVQ